MKSGVLASTASERHLGQISFVNASFESSKPEQSRVESGGAEDVLVSVPRDAATKIVMIMLVSIIRYWKFAFTAIDLHFFVISFFTSWRHLWTSSMDFCRRIGNISKSDHQSSVYKKRYAMPRARLPELKAEMKCSTTPQHPVNSCPLARLYWF